MKKKPNTFTKHLLFSFLAAFLCISSASGAERNAVGKVIAVRGNVLVTTPDSEPKELTLKDSLFLQDTIKTNQGRVQIVFMDNTLITLGQNTELKITHFFWREGDKSSTLRTDITEGAFRIMGGKITKTAPDNFKTDTPSGTIGIRGSMYAGVVDDSGTTVVFLGGKGIYVENEAGITDITEPGFSLTVESQSDDPGEPVKMTPEQLEELETLFATSEEEIKAAEAARDSEPLSEAGLTSMEEDDGDDVAGINPEAGMPEALENAVSDATASVEQSVPDYSVTSGSASTLPATWNGFFTGVSENMASPTSSRRVFRNTSATGFQMSLDRANGTVTGSMSGTDVFNPSNNISVSGFGGSASNSVYISDNILGADLNGGNASINGSFGGFKPNGNYIATSSSGALSSYTNWGNWEAAYTDPDNGNEYHIQNPGALWIAGEQTPASTVAALITADFSATYTGGAQGVRFDGASLMTALTGGSTTLTIDFDSGAMPSVDGTINFDGGISLLVSSFTPVTTSGFSADITNALTGSVNGTFFGPNAEAVGGNFSAQMPGGVNYHGVFAGDR